MTTLTTGRATDFITFSRPGATGGGATVTDRDGKIKWAGHNLLLQSESFDISSPGWGSGGGGTTVNANKYVAPNGTTTADEVVASGANASRSQTVSLTAADYKLRFWVRAGASDTFRFGLNNGSWLASSSVIISGSGSVSGSGLTTVSGLDNNWTLVELSATATTASTSVFLYPGPSTQSAGNSIGIWGAHLYRSDLGGMVLNPARGDAYYPTTPRNLLGSTEDFSAAAWTKTNILAFGSGSVSNAIVAPNGLQTADKIVSSTANNNHRVQWSVAGVLVSGTKYVFSFYAKAAEYTKVQIADAVYSVYSARFDLTGSGSVVASSGCTAAITSVGDGWYRCSAIYTSGGANAWAHISPYPDSGATFTVDGASYLGDGISGIYVWGAQLSDSASLDAYSPVYGAAVTSAAYYAPRLDFDPVTLAARGLLVEEQRTNVLLHTAAFDVSATWVPTEVNVSTDAAVAPDGTTTADKFIPSTNALQHRLQQNVTSISSTVTGSVYVKLDGSGVNKVALFNGGTACIAYFNLSTLAATGEANVTSPTITPVGSGWFRLQATWPASQPTTRLSIFASSGSDGLAAVAGNGTDGIFIWGAQLEAGSFATSYIPNGAATAGATRTADVASVSTQAFPYSASEGTVIVNAAFLTAQSPGLRFAWQLRNDGSNRIAATGSPNSALFRHLSFVGGTPVGVVDYNVAQSFKDAFAYKADDYAGSTAGSAVVPDTTGAVPPAAVDLNLGNNANASDFLNGHIRQITYIPRRLSNAELQARTV